MDLLHGEMKGWKWPFWPLRRRYCGPYGPISPIVDILLGMFLLALIARDHVKSQKKFEFSVPCAVWVLNPWSWVARIFVGWKSFSMSRDTKFKGPYLFNLTWYRLGMKYQFIMYTPEWKHKDRLIPRMLSFKKESFEIVISHASTVVTAVWSCTLCILVHIWYCAHQQVQLHKLWQNLTFYIA